MLFYLAEIRWLSLPEPGDPNVYPVGVWNGQHAAAILTVRNCEITKTITSERSADPSLTRAVREYVVQTGLRPGNLKTNKTGGNTK